MAHILKRDKAGNVKRIPIYVDPKTDRPDPKRDPEGKYFDPSDSPKKPAQASEGKSLSDHTIAELKAMAEDEEIDLGGASKKDDIVAAIEGARSA